MTMSLPKTKRDPRSIFDQALTTDPKATTMADHLDVVDQVFTQLQFDRIYLEQEQNPFPAAPVSKETMSPMILHVDDDPDLVDAVTSRFKARGFRVTSALDGISGMHSALVNPADAIILDYDMPNGRGDKVIELLKSNRTTEVIPIVVLTAVHEKGLRRRLLAQGADVFMTKPFDFAELEQTVSRLIESKS